MEQDQAPQKRRGRPPKAVDRPKNASFTFRLLPGLREKLEASAAARSVSMSEEIERRLEASFQSAADPYLDTALRMAAANCDVIRQLLGKGIAEDPFTRAACSKAAASAIELVGGLAGQDTPEARALLQADQQTYAEGLGQVVAMLIKALLDGAPKDAIDGLSQIIEAVAERRRAEIVESDRLHRQTLARLLRGGAPAEIAPEPAFRPATPDELAGMVDAPGLLPPEIADRAALDDAVSDLPTNQGESVVAAPKRRRAKVSPTA